MKTPAQSEGQTSKECLELVPQENELKTPMFSGWSPKWDILIHIHVSVPQELISRVPLALSFSMEIIDSYEQSSLLKVVTPPECKGRLLKMLAELQEFTSFFAPSLPSDLLHNNACNQFLKRFQVSFPRDVWGTPRQITNISANVTRLWSFLVC